MLLLNINKNTNLTNGGTKNSLKGSKSMSINVTSSIDLDKTKNLSTKKRSLTLWETWQRARTKSAKLH